MKGLLLITCMIKVVRCRCRDVMTDFRLPMNTVTINNVIGIPDSEMVEIGCECLEPSGADPEWSYNDRVISDRGRRDDDEAYIINESPYVTLKVESFEEDSSGLYACYGRDTTVEFNLAWYEPSKLYLATY